MAFVKAVHWADESDDSVVVLRALQWVYEKVVMSADATGD